MGDTFCGGGGNGNAYIALPSKVLAPGPGYQQAPVTIFDDTHWSDGSGSDWNPVEVDPARYRSIEFRGHRYFQGAKFYVWFVT